MKYLVSYFLNNPPDTTETPYDDLPECIYSFDPDAAYCFDHVWLINTTAEAKQISERIKRYLKLNDKLIVAGIKQTEFSGFGEQLTTWLNGGIDS